MCVCSVGFSQVRSFDHFSLAKSISNRRKFIAQICCSCEVNFLGNFLSVSGGVVGVLLFLVLFREVKISFLTIVFFLFSFLFGEVKMAAPIHPIHFWYPPLEFRKFMCGRIHHFSFKLLQFFRFHLSSFSKQSMGRCQSWVILTLPWFPSILSSLFGCALSFFLSPQPMEMHSTTLCLLSSLSC